MSLPAQQDLQLRAWDTEKVRFNVVDADGNPRTDMLDYSNATLEVRANPGDPLLLSLDASSGTEIGESYIDVLFKGSVLADQSWDAGQYDLVVFDDDGESYVVVTGGITIDPAIYEE